MSHVHKPNVYSDILIALERDRDCRECADSRLDSLWTINRRTNITQLHACILYHTSKNHLPSSRKWLLSLPASLILNKERLKMLNRLTLWSLAPLERPQVVQPLSSFPAFYGMQRFITAFTRALHLYLS
jgi:hypothetical protein